MNIKRATKSELLTTQLETTQIKKKNKGNNQSRNKITGMEIIWRVIRWEGEGGKYAVFKKHNGRYKIDRESLRIVWKMGKPKNLYA